MASRPNPHRVAIDENTKVSMEGLDQGCRANWQLSDDCAPFNPLLVRHESLGAPHEIAV